MSQFTYESQGAETVLVCQLEEQEHIDSFAKGMLQSNDIAGLVKPSYSQRDMNQYLKYPVTSKIPLKDLLTVEMDRKDALKLCLSIANAAKEMEEYMLSPEKLMLGLEYVFVDVRKKEVSFIYLPIDEFSESQSMKEFLLGVYSHICYQLDGDVSYVAKLFHYLNQEEAWDFDGLRHFVEKLMMETVKPKSVVVKPVEMQTNPAPAPVVSPQMPVSSTGVLEQKEPVRQSAAPVIAADSVLDGAETAKKTEAAPEKHKKGLFGMGFGKTEKPAKKKVAAPAIPGALAIPGTPAIPGAPAIPGTPAIPGAPVIPRVPGTSEPQVTSKIQEVPGIPPVAEKKKGLFDFGKKKPAKKPITPVVPEWGKKERPVQPQAPGYVQPQSQVIMQSQNPALDQPQNQSFSKPMIQPAPLGENSVYVGEGSSDDGNQTVILGGGDQYQSTVILGAEMPGTVAAEKGHQTARIIRRKNGQSMIISQKSIRIGSEGSFVDFYIADNPAVGACHADIARKGGEWYITDRNSANHTYVDGTMIPPMQAVPLRAGAQIRLADEEFEFVLS